MGGASTGETGGMTPVVAPEAEGPPAFSCPTGADDRPQASRELSRGRLSSAVPFGIRFHVRARYPGCPAGKSFAKRGLSELRENPCNFQPRQVPISLAFRDDTVRAISLQFWSPEVPRSPRLPRARDYERDWHPLARGVRPLRLEVRFSEDRWNRLKDRLYSCARDLRHG